MADAGIAPIVVAIPENWRATAEESLAGISDVRLVAGGATPAFGARRAGSARSRRPDLVLIHDAARPDLPESVIAALVEALARHEAAIPVLPVVDSLVRGGDGMMLEPARREGLYRSADAPGVPLPGDPRAPRLAGRSRSG
jgi:2-C-methyl-D-erythritol 4-phosphate cytidylyltransferase/2-C-methyl-D-erythritol 2,4-cyclodiphosphate synthase